MSLFISRPLAKEAVDSIIQDKLRWILQSVDPLAVVVFGSAARGEMTERSDVDIALVFPDEESLKAGRTSIFGRPPIDMWPTDLRLRDRRLVGVRGCKAIRGRFDRLGNRRGAGSIGFRHDGRDLGQEGHRRLIDPGFTRLPPPADRDTSENPRRLCRSPWLCPSPTRHRTSSRISV
jgi:hypothetical protein